MTVARITFGPSAAALLILAATLPACSGRDKTPATPPPPAAELLQRASANLKTAHSLSFTFTAQPVVPGLRFAAVSGGEGTVIWPDRLIFQGTMQSTPTLAAPVVLVMCGSDRYVELAGDGKFMKMDVLPDVHRLLFAPDSGLATGALTNLEKVAGPEAATLDGTPMWRLTGTVAGRFVAMLPGHAQPSADSLQATLWIGQQDNRLHQATLHGPMFDGDTPQTIRTLVFSHFDEALPFQVPRGQLPCGA